ncbi:hypothetical protein [Pseudarthrobacter sp. NamE5]|uniref:hypothetical protein n=1 Tax=Pseudarthrobacter sp. NamE5 TaxID=2576839 RepID=UPI00110B2F98|nr:hypothetical protein [Pseudarthrobacter sp. NamE5]TLM82482.1 hypothetical protein FDW84_15855 [Pseudarthrobacter sp. NamE5]
MTVTSPTVPQSAFRMPLRVLSDAPDRGGPPTLIPNAGVPSKEFPAAPEGCDEGCHFCEGPETD